MKSIPHPSFCRSRNSMAAWLCLLPLLTAPAWGPAASPGTTEVPPVDLSAIDPSLFADDELDLPYYLAHFHRVANAVQVEGELRGWLTASVWRGDGNQRTYNARVLESHLSLAYFYCTDRPWNPYHGHPAVRVRLEAMLERWCGMQDPEGRFSEYGEGVWNLAATAFATKFAAETLRLLENGPPIDAALHKRVKEAQRKAILIVLTDPDFWNHGRRFSNQFTNVWPGALAWLLMHPDDTEIRTLLRGRMELAAEAFQSPAGYFYEREGPDWGYNLSTHQSNLHAGWYFARGTAFEPLVTREVRRFFDWMRWNAALDSNQEGFILNRAIETRQRRGWNGIFMDSQARNFSEVPAAEVVAEARAFVPNRDQVAGERRAMRADLKRDWPAVAPLQIGDFRAYTPYAFLHRSTGHWSPTPEQQAEQWSLLPSRRFGNHVQLRADDRRNVHYLFVRRPGYYAVFNGGEQIDDQQRLGLGLFWSPDAGALAQSQTGSDVAAWGTVAEGARRPFEAGDVSARILLSGQELKPAPGVRDFAGAGALRVSYPLGDKGRKDIRFDERQVRIDVEHAGVFVESVPLLLESGDTLERQAGNVLLKRNGKTVLAIRVEGGAAVDVSGSGGRVGPYEVRAVRIEGRDRLSYVVEPGPGV